MDRNSHVARHAATPADSQARAVNTQPADGLHYFSGHARPDRVCFEYAAPPYRDEYARIFEHAECFEQPFSGVVFARALLDIPSPHKDEEVRDSLRAIAERRITRLV